MRWWAVNPFSEWVVVSGHTSRWAGLQSAGGCHGFHGGHIVWLYCLGLWIATRGLPSLPSGWWVLADYCLKLQFEHIVYNKAYLATILILTHWGRVMQTHICVSKLSIIGSDNGLSPGRRQAIIWTNAGILVIEPLGTNFCEILIEIRIFAFKKMYLKISSGKWRPFCLGLNVLIDGQKVRLWLIGAMWSVMVIISLTWHFHD